MDHTPYFRNCPDCETSVLLIHGILSTPRHFDFLIPHIPQNYQVKSILLAGHGGSMRDFSKASMKQWQAQVRQEIEHLRTPNIIIIGHSLGALLALQAATCCKRIQGLFLLNVPFIPQMRFSGMCRCLRIAFGKVRADDPIDIACYQDLGIRTEPYLWKYLRWIPNFISLLCFARQCRKIPASLKIPCTAFLGTNDELVHIRSRRYLTGNPHISLQILENGIHYGYTQSQQHQITSHWENFIKTI